VVAVVGTDESSGVKTQTEADLPVLQRKAPIAAVGGQAASSWHISAPGGQAASTLQISHAGGQAASSWQLEQRCDSPSIEMPRVQPATREDTLSDHLMRDSPLRGVRLEAAGRPAAFPTIVGRSMGSGQKGTGLPKVRLTKTDDSAEGQEDDCASGKRGGWRRPDDLGGAVVEAMDQAREPRLPSLHEDASSVDRQGFWRASGVSGSGSLEQPCHVDDVIAAAQVHQWSVVKADTEETLTFPMSADTALVLIEPMTVLDACRLGRRLKSQQLRASVEHPEPRMVGVLLGSDWAADRARTVLAQRELMSCGFADVVVKSGGREDFELAVLMSLVRADSARAAAAELQEARRQLTEADKEVESSRSMFWQSVHRIYKSFPEMEEDILAMPQIGDVVGPCRLEKLMGRGGMGEVYCARNVEDNSREAVKVVDKSTLSGLDAVGALVREIECLDRLRHEHIIALRGAMHGPNHIFIFMDLAGPRNLVHVLRDAGGALRTKVAQSYQAQLMSAIAHCHDKNVAHRDLKPENIVVSACNSRITLVDFGLAVPCHKPCRGAAGTMPFVAPEILAANRMRPYRSAPCDIWGASVVLLEMLCGMGKLNRMLGWCKNIEPCAQRAEELRSYFSAPDAIRNAFAEDRIDVEDDLLELLQGMLQPDAKQRLTASEIVGRAWLSAHEPMTG